MLNMPLVLGQELIGVVKWGDERAHGALAHRKFSSPRRWPIRPRSPCTTRGCLKNAPGASTPQRVVSSQRGALDQRRIGRGAAPHQHRGARDQRRGRRVALHLRRAHRFIHARLCHAASPATGVPSHLRSTGMTRRVVKEGKPLLVTGHAQQSRSQSAHHRSRHPIVDRRAVDQPGPDRGGDVCRQL